MQRPTAVTVFGVLNIVFGVMAVTCTPFALITTKLSQRMLDNLPEASRMENPVLEMMQSPGFMAYTYVSTAVGMAFGALAILLAAEFGDLQSKVPDHVFGGRDDCLNLAQLPLGGDQSTLCGRRAGLCRGECGAQNSDLRCGLRHAENLPRTPEIVQ